MDKMAQSRDIAAIIQLIFAFVILVPFISLVFSLIGSMNIANCPKCSDCSAYQTELNDCNIAIINLTEQLNQTPIKYIQNISYVEVPVEKEIIVYRETLFPVMINVLAFLLSTLITINLFRIQLRLPKDLEDKLERIEKAIIFVKISSLFVSILILIRLIYTFWNIY